MLAERKRKRKQRERKGQLSVVMSRRVKAEPREDDNSAPLKRPKQEPSSSSTAASPASTTTTATTTTTPMTLLGDHAAPTTASSSSSSSSSSAAAKGRHSDLTAAVAVFHALLPEPLALCSPDPRHRVEALATLCSLASLDTHRPGATPPFQPQRSDGSLSALLLCLSAEDDHSARRLCLRLLSWTAT